MRIDLACPYDEKDWAKRLGARWDPTRKVWYVENREDLSPFMRWIKPARLKRAHQPIVVERYISPDPLPSCDCETPPWEDCAHTTWDPINDFKAAMAR